MIDIPVVLVLGAGASRPYGFPDGNELVHEALYPSGGVYAITNWLYQNGFTEAELTAFRTELEASLIPSIDAFLETRTEYEKLGKTIIAYLLMHRENPENLFRLERNPEKVETWYGTLFRLMYTPNKKLFRKNQLSIITYNYDRSLEYCLLRVLEATYGIKRDESLELLQQHIPIIHLHGWLGELHGEGEDVREYESDLSPKNLEIAVRNIKIVHDVDPSESQFEKVYEVLQGATNVVFLGFGYHRKNVERLHLHESCPNAKLWGTCKGFTEGEKGLFIRPLIPTLTGRHLVDESVNEFLRNHPEVFVRYGQQ